MEDVLEVYTRPYDPQRPQVCMDEKAVQLIGETRLPLPVKAGREARCDFEYVRRGVTTSVHCRFVDISFLSRHAVARTRL